jgi:hypothetical protein
MEFLTKEKDGRVIIREFFGSIEITKESLNAFTEATKGGKTKGKLVVTIAGIHEGVTRNLTEYLPEELEKSIPSWTAPYNTPVLINHDQANVDATIGRIINAQMGDHNGKKALMFTVEITDQAAMQKIKDERYYTVSIGSRVNGIKCSICGNDWVNDYCEHERGHYYLTDESDPKSAKQCTWQMLGMEGLELSYVAVPSDKNAMNIAASLINNSMENIENLDDLCAKLYMFSESGAIDLIKKGGTMEHVGEEEVVADLVDSEEDVENTETEEEEDVTTDEETTDEEDVEDSDEADDVESETDDTATDEDVEDEADSDEDAEDTVEDEEDAASEDEPETDEEVEDEEAPETDEEEVGGESAELISIKELLNSMRSELKQARLELLISLKGIDNLESNEAKEIASRYEDVDEQVVLDLVRGERANKIAIGLASIKNSVDNPTLTEDPTGDPHNPGEKDSSVKVRVKGSDKTLNITNKKEDRVISVKVRK